MKAHQLIADPSKFTTGTLARDSKGKPCGTGPGAKPIRFDALGAIFWCYPGGAHNKVDPNTGKTPCQKARELAQQLYGKSLGRLEHDEALRVLTEVDA